MIRLRGVKPFDLSFDWVNAPGYAQGMIFKNGRFFQSAWNRTKQCESYRNFACEKRITRQKKQKMSIQKLTRTAQLMNRPLFSGMRLLFCLFLFLVPVAYFL